MSRSLKIAGLMVTVTPMTSTVLGWFFGVLWSCGCLAAICVSFQRGCARRMAGAGWDHLLSEAAVTLAMYSTLVAPLMRSLGLALMVTP